MGNKEHLSSLFPLKKFLDTLGTWKNSTPPSHVYNGAHYKFNEWIHHEYEIREYYSPCSANI